MIVSQFKLDEAIKNKLAEHMKTEQKHMYINSPTCKHKQADTPDLRHTKLYMFLATHPRAQHKPINKH